MTAKFRGRTAVVGISLTPYYKRGTAPEPEMKLALRAIVAACEEAGIDPRDVDGFVSYGSERSSGQQLMLGLGTRDLRFGGLVWTHGGGIPGAVGMAASAIITGQAEVVAVYRSMAEASNMRLRVAVAQNDTPAQQWVNGLDSAAQTCAIRSQRMFEADGIPRSTMKAMVMAAYHHANNNPTAYGRNTKLDSETYDSARLISEPYNLFDCSRENDAASAVILVSAERAKDLKQKPAYVLSAPMGCAEGWGSTELNHKPFGWSSGFASVARRMWAESGYGPKDVDVAQIYENFSGMGVGAIIDHGFCTVEGAGEFIRYENLIAPDGKLPINTSGGNLADGFIHGMGLVPEAVRQIRGTSTNQAPGAKISLMTGGTGDLFMSSALFGSEETL